MMWIRMLSTAAGPRLLPHHCLERDKVYQVEDELGEDLVKIRAAVEVDDPNPKKPEASAAEVAAVDDGETSTDPDAEKKSENLIDRLKPRASKRPAKE